MGSDDSPVEQAQSSNPMPVRIKRAGRYARCRSQTRLVQISEFSVGYEKDGVSGTEQGCSRWWLGGKRQRGRPGIGREGELHRARSIGGRVSCRVQSPDRQSAG